MTKDWVHVDADGQTLGRLASGVAKLLRGKYKPNFTPHVDCGDNVIVTNADKINLTGKKWDSKEYIRHTGYPGGQRSLTATELFNKGPERLIENAVKGMLPKTKLSRQVIKKLKVYAGGEHPHTAQKPEALTIER